MIKVIGGLHGLFGDLVMQTSAIKSLKKLIPNCHYTMAVSQKYKSIEPLFRNNYLIDDFYVWSGNDFGLTKEDEEYQKKFDIILPAFPKHIHCNWYNYRHYLEETALMLGLSPNYEDIGCFLNPWFGKNEKYNQYVSISAFPSQSKNLSKTLTMDKWEYIVSEINKIGFKAIQLGGEFDLQIKGAEKPNFTFLEAAQCLFSSRLQITTDTSWAWIGSAYKINAIGLYGLNYQDMINPQSHFPINPNATYLWSKTVDKINISNIIEVIHEKIRN